MATTRTRKELSGDRDFVNYLTDLAALGRLSIPVHGSAEVENISGNINRVRRVRFIGEAGPVASFIVKLVPRGGALEKYPQISFPEDRLRFEAFYYESAALAARETDRLARWVPRLFHDDPENEILVLEDLAPGRSLEASILGRAPIAEDFFADLGEALARFHSWSRTLEMAARFASNPSAAANRPYVLTLSLEHPEVVRGIWGEREGARELISLQEEFLGCHGERLAPMARSMAARFLEGDPAVLTHGDLHGESLFLREGGATVLDAELCDRGAAWFDAGMLLAHLAMLSAVTGKDAGGSRFLSAYLTVLKPESPQRLLHEILAMAGFEMIRRIIGAANAAYVTHIELKTTLLERAAELVLAPGSTRLCKEAL